MGFEEFNENKKEIEKTAEHYNVTMKKNWEDPLLPEEFEVNVWETTYKGAQQVEGSKGPSYLTFKGLSFSIPRKKMPNLSNLKIGDPIKVYKLNHDGVAYRGDGIIKVKNLRTGESFNFSD